MRILAACTTCSRQYEVRDLRPGHRFHCHCGTVVTIPSHGDIHLDALHCGSCGAARRGKADGCAFCGTAYLNDRRNRTTICPKCYSHIADDAKFCDNCGLGINAILLAGETTDLNCPVCGIDQHLRSRTLEHADTTTDECTSCGGLWLHADFFEGLVAKARTASVGRAPSKIPPPAALIKQPGPLYRPCPVCTQMMNRRNYGRGSGIVIDSCKTHGTWFDSDELGRILAWVHAGGLDRAQARERSERSRPKSTPVIPSTSNSMSDGWGSNRHGSGRHLVEDLFDVLVDLFSSR